MKKAIIFIVCFHTISNGIYNKYKYFLGDASYIKKTFQYPQAIVFINKPLFVHLLLEASKNDEFKNNYLFTIKSEILQQDLSQEWCHCNGKPFYTILQFIPWDGRNNHKKYNILVNNKEVQVNAYTYCSRSFPEIQIIEFIGGNDILTEPEYYAEILLQYETLMRNSQDSLQDSLDLQDLSDSQDSLQNSSYLEHSQNLQDSHDV